MRLRGPLRVGLTKTLFPTTKSARQLLLKRPSRRRPCLLFQRLLSLLLVLLSLPFLPRVRPLLSLLLRRLLLPRLRLLLSLLLRRLLLPRLRLLLSLPAGSSTPESAGKKKKRSPFQPTKSQVMPPRLPGTRLTPAPTRHTTRATRARGAVSARGRPTSARLSVGHRARDGLTVAAAEVREEDDDDQVEEPRSGGVTVARDGRSGAVNVNVNVSQAPSTASGHTIHHSGSEAGSVPLLAAGAPPAIVAPPAATPTATLPAPGRTPAGSSAAHAAAAIAEVVEAPPPTRPETAGTVLDPRAYRQTIGARRVPVFNSDEGRAARVTAQRRLASAMDADAPEPSGRPRRRLTPAGPEP